jgi:hypothetical protein
MKREWLSDELVEHCRAEELPAEVVEHVAGQVGAEPSAWRAYPWGGRIIEYRRAQVRRLLDFREATVADTSELATWLTDNILSYERQLDRARTSRENDCATPGSNRPVRSSWIGSCGPPYTTTRSASAPRHSSGSRLAAAVVSKRWWRQRCLTPLALSPILRQILDGPTSVASAITWRG